VGNIGDKLKINTSYNTEATFDFENQVKLNYTGYEDEIIQKIEAGNVSLPSAAR
jgi:cell surface protein SprA